MYIITNNLQHKFKTVEKKINTLIIILLCFFTQLLNGIDNVVVWPYEIYFNYEDGYENDAYGICNAIGELPTYLPEWIIDDEENSSRFAYIKGQTNRKIVVRFDTNYPDSDSLNLIINLTVVSGSGIGTICNLFVPNYSKSDYLTLNLNGTIPNSVGIKNFTWKWEIYAIPNNITNYCSAITDTNSFHSYFSLFDVPKEPMPVPWSSVLDKACEWADGKSSESDILSALTTNLYFNSGLYYDSYQTHYEIVSWPNARNIFNLSNFLYEWNYADCRDCSMFLSILSASIGTSLTQTKRIQGQFETKSLLPIGWYLYQWTENRELHWFMHHVAWLNNIYDPTVQLKPSNPYIPIDVNIDNPYKIDLYVLYSGTWSPYSPFTLGETDPYFNVPTEIQ